MLGRKSNNVEPVSLITEVVYMYSVLGDDKTTVEYYVTFAVPDQTEPFDVRVTKEQYAEFECGQTHKFYHEGRVDVP